MVHDTCQIEVRVFEKASEKFVFDEHDMLIESISLQEVEQLTDYKFFALMEKLR